MSFKINPGLTWVGKIDWELRKFHGEEYSTHRGSSYNSYLIQDEKTILMDTVWMPFAQEFVENLQREIDVTQIDAIVMNHGEIDHSGALPELMKLIPDPLPPTPGISPRQAIPLQSLHSLHFNVILIPFYFL